MPTIDLTLAAFEEHRKLVDATVARCADAIDAMTSEISRAFRSGNKLLLFGNGGSAADAQHVATEFVCRYRSNRVALPAIALVADGSVTTSIGNDLGYERVFSRQIEALARPGDVAIGISTSGASPNVLKALEMGREMGAVTIGVTGEMGGRNIAANCDIVVAVPSNTTSRIQEMHILIWHVVCERIEAEYLGS